MNKRPAFLVCVALLATAGLAPAAELVIPQGTVVFGELDERITSNEKKFRIGYPVDGHVWKDVVVGGHTVIPAGTPLELRISKLRGSNVGGRGGSLEIMAVTVKAADGTEITLRGGYDESGNDRYGVSRTLSMVLWPAGFLPGKRAVLDKGTVFDATIPADTRVTVADAALPTLKLPPQKDLTVEVLYDDIDPKDGTLPLAMTLCNREFTRDANITAVNEMPIQPILVAIILGKRGERCHEFTGRANLESLRSHFSPGINRFSVTMGGVEDSVVLNIEM